MSAPEQTPAATDEAPAQPEPWLTVKISPEPSEEERDALMAALTAYLVANSGGSESDLPAESVSHWTGASRRMAIRGIAKSVQMGWGRSGPGWPG